MKYTLIICLLLLGFQAQAQKERKILLENGTLHVGNGRVIEKSLVGIKGNKIVLVENALAFTYQKSDWDTIINVLGQHIYPGFVAPNSTLGLTEIDAVRATRDFQEVGIFNPHVRALIAFNVESKVIATVRTNGVLLAQATPRGGSISGTSSVMHLNGWNWEDAVAKKDDGIHINWPSSLQGRSAADKKKNEQYEKQKLEINQFFSQAKAYLQNSDNSPKDIRFEAMRSIFENGEKRVYFHANEIQQLLDVVDFVHLFGIRYPVIVGGYDSHLITKQLADSKIAVMLPRLHSLPELEEDATNLVYRLPALLQAGGVLFCLQNEGDMEAMNTRNLPFLAGTAMAYGLTEEQAIRSISLSACEIMGMDKTYGSVEKGKNATLFVSKGNALDMRTNQVQLILMNGEIVPLSNSQTELYEKYSKKK